MVLSEHFSLEELTITQHRELDNTPPTAVLERLALVLAPGLEKVRALLGKPVLVNSGYRSPAVNAAVGGAQTSAHLMGYAADIISPGFGSPLAVCRAIVAAGFAFDQLIEEGTWTHISFDPRARRQVMTKRAGGGYGRGLPPDPRPHPKET